jgi:elongation factor G
VPYRETITSSAKVEYKHKKQTGGHGQYGHVFLELQPQDRSVWFEFGSSVVGGNAPKEYMPDVEKAVLRALQEWIIAGYPVADLKVTFYDGFSHPVDSSGMAVWNCW